MSRTSYPDYAAEGSLVFGGGAAILLQLGDPVVARGVADHSGFASDPMRRLRHTLAYVYAIGLGTPGQSAQAARAVNRAHSPVPGAYDPGHQLWVAATLHQVGVQVHEMLFGPLDPALADEVYARSAALGTALQLPPERWPVDRAAFAEYWADAVAGLEVTEAAQGVARDLLHPRTAPLWLKMGMPLARVVTAGLLPPGLRAAYGLPDRPRRFRAAIGFLRIAVRITPRRLRQLPSRRLMPNQPPGTTSARP